MICQQVETQVVVDKNAFRRMIWLKFGVYGGLFAVAYTALYLVRDPAIFVVCFMLYGFAALLLAFNFAHDFAHNTIFKRKKWNHLGFVAIYTVMGAHAEAWKYRHIHAHHYAPNVKDYDPDLKLSKLIRVIPGSAYYWYHRYQYLYAPFAYMIYSLFWIFIKDFVILYSKDEFTPQKNWRYHLSFWLQKAVYGCLLLVFPLLYSGQSQQMVLTGFLCMHLSQSLLLLFTFLMTHHVERTSYPTTDQNGQINASWLMNQVKSSNDMDPFSKTANFIWGGFNNHIAHHLFPHYHHIYYPEINKILYPILQKNNIQPNHTTYWGGIVSHLKLLKRMGQPLSDSTTK